MTFANWTFHPDALLARIVYPWRWRVVLGGVMVVTALLLRSGLVPPVWRGIAYAAIQAPAAATVEVDGRPWPHTLYAGTHMAVASFADGRRSWTEFTTSRGITTTVTLSAGLGPVRVRQLPAAAPGTQITRVSYVNAAWRIESSALVVPPSNGNSQPGTLQPAQTVALGARGLEPLATLDAFGGRADEWSARGERREAVFRPAGAGQPVAALEVRGWRDELVTVPMTTTVSVVRFAPDGESLLYSEQAAPGGERLFLLAPAQPPQLVVAVPGTVRDVIWDPRGQGAVIASEAAGRVTLTLARLRAPLAARVIADTPAHPSGGAAVASGSTAAPSGFVVAPMQWRAGAVEWLATEPAQPTRLWRAPLDSLIPEPVTALDAVAFWRFSDNTLRVMSIVHGRVVLGQHHDGRLVVEATLPHLPADDRLRGYWSPTGDTLLVQRDGAAWIVDLAGSEPATTP